MEEFDEPISVEIQEDNGPLTGNVLGRPGQTPESVLAGGSRSRALSQQAQLLRQFGHEQLEPETKNHFGFTKSYHAASRSNSSSSISQLRPLLQLERLYSREAASNTSNAMVVLNIYDIGTGSVGQTVNSVLRHFGTGAFHCGVDVYGREWSFSDTEDGTGLGVFCSQPRCCNGHTYCQSVTMGRTSMTQFEVLQLIHLMSSYWPVASYDILTHNCCHFCQEFCQRLCVGPVPSWIMSLAGAGAAIVATGDATCCREVAREVVGHATTDKICCVDPGLSGDVILYHL